MSDSMPNQQPLTAYAIKAQDENRIRLLQLTDCHILADAEDCLKGINTRSSLDAVCQAALADHQDLDLVLATGDLSQDGSSASYDYLAGQLDGLGAPVFWLPGNHDDVTLMHNHLRGDSIFAHKQLLAGNWTIVLLDSTVPGETGGRLGDAQLDFLDTALSTQPDRHALVCLHHQPIPIGSEWMDQLGLAQSERFIDRVTAHKNLRGVLWGHVHQERHQYRHGVEWMASPSTCVQFKPGSQEFALDDLPPGYRRIDLLADGRIESDVWRVDCEPTE